MSGRESTPAARVVIFARGMCPERRPSFTMPSGVPSGSLYLKPVSVCVQHGF
jgi:hypothetical protein